MKIEDLNRIREKDGGSPLDRLSPRELQVVVAISTGMQPAEAAYQIGGISVKTFSTYRSRVLEKLNLNSNAELAILAHELRLVPGVLQRYTEKKDGHDGSTEN